MLLLSAGIGATRVLAMLHALVIAGSERQIWWLHGARNSHEHPFAAEANALLARLPHARAEICYSAALPPDQLGRGFQHPGRSTGGLLAGWAIPVDARAYVCGPATFMGDVRTALIGLGLDPARVLT